MEQISNKVLATLLIAAIVVSIGSTMISFQRLNRVISPATGRATTGLVNVTITSTTSLTLADSQINFGSCAPTATYGCNVSSNSSAADCSCTSGVWPDNLTVQNDGNRPINVTVKTDRNASDLVGGTSPLFWFSTRNSTARPGCFKGDVSNASGISLQWDWQDFGNVTSTDYNACTNLTYEDTNDQFELFAKLFLPANAPVRTGRNATLTFTATGI